MQQPDSCMSLDTHKEVATCQWAVPYALCTVLATITQYSSLYCRAHGQTDHLPRLHSAPQRSPPAQACSTNLTCIQHSSRIDYEDKQKRWPVAIGMRFQSVHEARWKISQGWQGIGYGDRAGRPRPMQIYLGRLVHIDGFKNVYWMHYFGQFLVKVSEVFTAVRVEVRSYKEECF
jgi:hypothetical protein